MGLKGEEIPIGGRILAVIDAFQSMTIGRPYKQRMTVESAIQELFDCAGTQFDREVVDAYASVLAEEGQLAGKDKKRHGRELTGSGVGAPDS
jgi:HD-GYP domain-containing protein (c-di-GMP phosphodiesterase class II)